MLWETAEQEAYWAQMLDWQRLLCIPGDAGALQQGDGWAEQRGKGKLGQEKAV